MTWPAVLAVTVIGYLIGSVPTAGTLGRLFGVDLRSQGSGNPGAHNALRTSGPLLAALILAVEAVKGYLAVSVGGLAGEVGPAVAAGLSAMAGNVYNVWYRFSGGKGLGITLGVLAGLWPVVILPVFTVLLLAVLTTRSAGLATLAALGALIALSLQWQATGWPTGGLEPGPAMVAFACGATLIIAWKHWRDSPLTLSGRRRSRARSSPGHR